jgi:amino acid adenylation domain-containing protein
MLNDSKAAFIISQQHLAENLNDLTCTQLLLDSSDFIEQLSGYTSDNPVIESTDKQRFNIIYTSGSTGNPKGVIVPHSGIINRLQWMQKAYPLNAQSHVLQKTPFNFDVSVWELFWPLLQGAQLVYAKPEGHKDPDYLVDFIQQQGITTLHFVPSMLGVFLQSENIEQCSSITQVFTSGEALQLEHSTAFFQRLGFAELHNLYGPTEASIDVSYYACKAQEPHKTIPIGKPIDNTQLLVLDEELKLLPKGAVGELYIGGKNLALGYLNQPVLTAASFIDNPFIKQGLASKKLYKTGDIARYLHDGEIEYLGRVDHQVKIRGLRIELQEIEQQLRKIDSVTEAVVTTAEINQQTQIIAFLQGPGDIDKHAFHHLLQQQLPDYMLPFAYIAIDEIPLSANGKIDRKRLPLEQLSALSQARSTEFVAPRNDTELQLQRIWQDILNVEDIGIYDNFFELGGHSLLATRLASRIRSEFSCELELKAIFDQPSIADLSVLILEQAIETLDIDDDELLKLLDEIDDELE